MPPPASHARVRADTGARAGVALNPATPLDAVRHVLDLVDHLFVMKVNPGFGGQGHLSSMEPKIRDAAELIARTGRTIDLEVDGGISPTTVAGAAGANARLLVAGSALYRDPEGLDAGVTDLRARAIDALRAQTRKEGCRAWQADGHPAGCR